MNNLPNDELQEQKKREAQINTQVHAEPQQLNAEPQQVDAAPQQINAQQQAHVQVQNTVLQNAQQQIPLVIPDTAAQLDTAYAEVRGKQRMSSKERKKRANIYAQKQATSLSIKAQLEEYTRRDAVLRRSSSPQDLGAANEALNRSLTPWLDDSGTPEAEQANRRFKEGFISENKTVRFENYNQLFDRFLSLDSSKLKVGTDQEFAEHYTEYRKLVDKGFQIKITLDKAKAAGMPIDPERERQLRAKADLFESAHVYSDALSRLISSPYYALLRKEDTAKFSDTELNRRMSTAMSRQHNQELFNYYWAVNAMRQNTAGFKRATNPEDMQKKACDKRQAEFETNSKLYPLAYSADQHRQIDENWGIPAVGYNSVGELRYDHQGALKGGGIGRMIDHTNLILGVYLYRTGKKYGEPLTDEDKAGVQQVRTEIEDVLVNQNTVEMASEELVEMAKGVLSVKMDFMLDTPEALMKNMYAFSQYGAMLQSVMQLCTSNANPAGEAAWRQLPLEARQELLDRQGYCNILFEPLNSLIKIYRDPHYKDYLEGKPVTESERFSFGDVQILQDYLHECAGQMKAAKTGDFKLPHDFKYNYFTYSMVRGGTASAEDIKDGKAALQQYYHRRDEEAEEDRKRREAAQN